MSLSLILILVIMHQHSGASPPKHPIIYASFYFGSTLSLYCYIFFAYFMSVGQPVRYSNDSSVRHLRTGSPHQTNVILCLCSSCVMFTESLSIIVVHLQVQVHS